MTSLELPVSDRDHFEGDPSAAVTVVEYGDYQCPPCGRAFPIVKRIQQEMGEKLRFVFRNFPLSQVHPDAESAAEAAEAAAAQGNFTQMHDLLFQNQDRLAAGDLIQYARQAGLDVARFEQDMKAGTYRERVREDLEGGIRSGVQGTPTFFVNGESYEGSWNFEPFLEALRRA